MGWGSVPQPHIDLICFIRPNASTRAEKEEELHCYMEKEKEKLSGEKSQKEYGKKFIQTNMFGF